MDILSEAKKMGLRWGRPDGVLVTRAAVVDEARSWIGTPWVHQAETKGLGADCGGLVRGVSVALGLIPANYQNYVPVDLQGYGRQPHGDLGRRLCDHYWTRIDPNNMQPGDIALIRFEADPQHWAIVGDYPLGGLSMIHSWNRTKDRKVIENRFDAVWMARVTDAYSMPGVA